MNSRFVIAILVVLLTVAYLVYSSVSATAKSVVTVGELLGGGPRSNVRVGARVAEQPIEPLPPGEGGGVMGIRFFVRDIQGPESQTVAVEYHHVVPENLKAGRDVILEGQYAAGKFDAKTLQTQCPSKYVPPTPGAAKDAPHAAKE